MRVLRAQAPRNLGRRATDRARPSLASDATIEPAPGPGPEEVFDRVTGPYAYGARRGLDEGT